MARGRGNEPPMPEPLAYFLTWPTYGTWLPGDERGWIQCGHGWQLPDPIRKLEAEAKMTEDASRLDRKHREVVERQIAETSKVRGWELHAANCRSNHVHVVVTASEAPQIVRNQLKAWCTRRLKELEANRRLADEGPRLRLVCYGRHHGWRTPIGLCSHSSTSPRDCHFPEGEARSRDNGPSTTDLRACRGRPRNRGAGRSRTIGADAPSIDQRPRRPREPRRRTQDEGDATFESVQAARSNRRFNRDAKISADGRGKRRSRRIATASAETRSPDRS